MAFGPLGRQREPGDHLAGEHQRLRDPEGHRRRTQAGTQAGLERKRERELAGCEFVENAALRECFERLQARGEINANVLALRVGMERKGRPGEGDGTRIKRVLGIVPEPSRRRAGEPPGTPRFRKHIRYELAVALALAMNVDPASVGV